MDDTTLGIGFRAYYADGQIIEGASVDAWAAAPATALVLCDVIEPKEYAPGKPYRWRMECEWFGCRAHPSGQLEFARWHEETRPADDAWIWKQGLLITDAHMDEIRALAD